MSCYHPSFIYRFYDKSTCFVRTKFLGGYESMLKYLDEFHDRAYDECKQLLRDNYDGKKLVGFIPQVSNSLVEGQFLQIPCGKCIGCRLDYSRSWADRMTYHSFGKEDCAYFLTLTYDDIHITDLPYSENYDLYSLNFNDFSEDFMKKLRNRFRDAQIDFYASSEYGDKQFRPHFHAIIYNCFIPDLCFFKLNNAGEAIYTSEIIEGLWQRGFCTISKFSWTNAAYVASYVEKKRDGRAMCEYTAVGLEPEKCRCSRRPGIAYDYYLDNHTDIWRNNGLSVDRIVNSSGRLGIPRYFRKLAVKNGIEHVREFSEWEENQNKYINIVNPLEIQNSSFDLSRVTDLLKFEEREILSKTVSRNF